MHLLYGIEDHYFNLLGLIKHIFYQSLYTVTIFGEKMVDFKYYINGYNPYL